MITAAPASSLPMITGEVLGSIHMIELRDSFTIAHDTFNAMWSSLGLNMAHAPKPRSGRDAFRKATPRKKLQGNLLLNEYKLRANLPDDAVMACVLVRATPTKRKARFTHANLAVIYLRESVGPDGSVRDWVDFTAYGTLSKDELAYITQVMDQFTVMLHQIDGTLIREAISRVLKDAKAVTFRAGAYMVPATEQHISAALETLIPWLNNFSKEPNLITSIAYVSTPDQDLQLETVLQRFIETQIESKILEADNYADRRKEDAKTVGDRKKVSMLGEMMSLQELISEYEQVMKRSLVHLRQDAIMAQTQIENILNS